MTTPPLPTLDQLAKQAESFVAQIAAFQAMTYQPKSPPIKANTYVTMLPGYGEYFAGGEVDLAIQVWGSAVELQNIAAGRAVSIGYMRPATNDEIKAHLIAEAEKRGIRVGVTVREDMAKSGFTNPGIWTVADLILISSAYEAARSSIIVSKCWETFKRPILISQTPSSHFPIDWVDVVPQNPVLSITVDGQTYTPTFKEGYVEFGCARIANEVIVAAHELVTKSALTPSPVPVWGDGRNRSVTSIRIGKGDFSTELLKGLIEEIKTREMTKDDGYDYYGPPLGVSSFFDGTCYLRFCGGVGVRVDNKGVSHPYSGSLSPMWTKLPNRAAAEALLRKATS